jgi:hypothetical protein
VDVSEETREITIRVAPTPTHKLGTGHLAEEAVGQDVAVGVWMQAIPDEPDPRRAVHMVSLQLGERENPETLTPDEVEYVCRVIYRGAEKIRQQYGGRGPGEVQWEGDKP